MLSPSKWHWDVPKSREGNLSYRLKMLHLAKGSVKNQSALREACRQDILFYINTFVWQYNPRQQGRETEPFVTWDWQDTAILELVTCIECHCRDERGVHQHDMTWEKSREIGATWMFLIVADWLARFHKDKDIMMISRSADAVDCESKSSLFWKIDHIQRHLPDWLQGKVIRRKMHFSYEDTGSSIVGEASTGRAGVGGRATVMFIDEFSQIKEDREVLHRTSDTTGCRLFNGTHLGTETAFAEICRREDMRKRVMHWTLHPEKRQGLYRYDKEKGQIEVLDKQFEYPADFQFVMAEAPAGGPHPGLRSPWYDLQCRRKPSPRAIAMDLDIDPGGSVSQFFNPLMVKGLITAYCREPQWEGDLSYDRDSGEPLGLIENPGGPIKLWLTPKSDSRGGLVVAEGYYAAGADISTGNGATNSCLSVIKADTGEKVLEYAVCTIEPTPLAAIWVALLRLFKTDRGTPARFAWESKGPGLKFGEKVLELGYQNVFYRRAHSTLANGKVSHIPGWNPTPETKLMLLETYRDALNMRQCVNPSQSALEECIPYRYCANGVEHPFDVKADDPTGARVNHGDKVIADALAWKMALEFDMIGRKEQARPLETYPHGSLGWRRMKRSRQESQRETTWA